MRSSRLKLFIVFVAVVAALLLVWATLIEPNRLVVHREQIALERWPVELSGLRVAALGDLHAGSAFVDLDKLHEIVAITNAQHPDLIVLLGDYVVTGRFYRHQLQPEIIADALKGLSAPLGVYAVLGNHDAWFDATRVESAFESVGIPVLDNSIVEVHKGSTSFWIVGLADLWTGVQHIEAVLNSVPDGRPVIALTHNPDIFPHVPGKVDLLIAAHTHGGQVAFPLIGRLVVPSKYGQRYAAGQVVEDGRHLFVTTGIGTSILPVRFRVPPEIALLSLNRR